MSAYSFIFNSLIDHSYDLKFEKSSTVLGVLDYLSSNESPIKEVRLITNFGSYDLLQVGAS